MLWEKVLAAIGQLPDDLGEGSKFFLTCIPVGRLASNRYLQTNASYLADINLRRPGGRSR